MRRTCMRHMDGCLSVQRKLKRTEYVTRIRERMRTGALSLRRFFARDRAHIDPLAAYYTRLRGVLGHLAYIIEIKGLDHQAE
jgi:hypothetical protein